MIQCILFLLMTLTAGAAISKDDELSACVTNSVGMVFSVISPGAFTMGSEREALAAPPYKVRITKPFYLGITEVTQEQYLRVMETNPAYFKDTGKSCLPVEQVSYRDAIQFCQRLGEIDGATYRLPSEAEWEYACRAGTESAMDSGTVSRAWCQSNSDGKTHPVATREPNAWGLYDMNGNVWEWVLDCAHVYPSGGLVDNPVCLKWLGAKRYIQGVIRGGAWDVGVERCVPWVRVHVCHAFSCAPFIGFRVVREVQPAGGTP